MAEAFYAGGNGKRASSDGGGAAEKRPKQQSGTRDDPIVLGESPPPPLFRPDSPEARSGISSSILAAVLGDDAEGAAGAAPPPLVPASPPPAPQREWFSPDALEGTSLPFPFVMALLTTLLNTVGTPTAIGIEAMYAASSEAVRDFFRGFSEPKAVMLKPPVKVRPPPPRHPRAATCPPR